jgi:hypothetical protein
MRRPDLVTGERLSCRPFRTGRDVSPRSVGGAERVDAQSSACCLARLPSAVVGQQAQHDGGLSRNRGALGVECWVPSRTVGVERGRVLQGLHRAARRLLGSRWPASWGQHSPRLGLVRLRPVEVHGFANGRAVGRRKPPVETSLGAQRPHCRARSRHARAISRRQCCLSALLRDVDPERTRDGGQALNHGPGATLAHASPNKSFARPSPLVRSRRDIPRGRTGLLLPSRERPHRLRGRRTAG